MFVLVLVFVVWIERPNCLSQCHPPRFSWRRCCCRMSWCCMVFARLDNFYLF